MKQSPSTRKKEYTLIAPSKDLPTLITTCPGCGGEIELWSEEEETVCLFCSQKLFDRERTTH